MTWHDNFKIGMNYFRWTIIGGIVKTPNGLYCLCRCECGNEKNVSVRSLKDGASSSCGCLRSERPNSVTHGLSKSRTHRIWAGIKNRCYNSRRDNYKYYGGRGISMCDEWKNNFEAFYRDMGECPDGFTIERIDVNGNYEKSNCKWMDKKLQGSNTRRNVFIEYGGESLTLSQWARKIGINYHTFHALVRYKNKTIGEIYGMADLRLAN